MNWDDCAHGRTPGSCYWEYCINSKHHAECLRCVNGDGSHVVSYVQSSRYESESAIQETERRIQELSSEVQSLRVHLKTLQTERTLALLDLVGDRTVIRFTKTFNGRGSVYHYAAIKSDGFWYITSSGYEYKKTSAELKKFIGDNPVEIMRPDKEL